MIKLLLVGLADANLMFIYVAALLVTITRAAEMMRRPDIWQNASWGACAIFIKLPESLILRAEFGTGVQKSYKRASCLSDR
jgi:hypothetical protein